MSESERLSQDHARRPARASLRRRFLLILLVMTILPGYIALLLLSATVSQSLHKSARSETFEIAQVLALELDSLLQMRLASFEQIISQPDVLAGINDALQNHQMGIGDVDFSRQPFRLNRPDMFIDLPFYIVDDKGRVVAEITTNAVLFDFQTPTPLEKTDLLNQLASGFPPGTFVFEPVAQDYSSPVLIVGTKIPGHEHLAVVTPLPLLPLFKEVERTNSNIGQRLVVVSNRLGVIYSTHLDSEFQLGLNRQKDKFFLPLLEGDPDLVPISVRSEQLGAAYSPSRAIQSFSNKAGFEPFHWAVVQTVDLDDYLAPIEPMFWTAVIVGLVLTIVALILALYVSARMVKPIVRLTEGIQRYAKGELDYRVEVRTRDELEVLAQAANEMALSLRNSHADLANQNKELDEKASQLEMIHSISYSVNRVLDLEKMFGRIIKEMRKQIPCDRISLGLLDPREDLLRMDYVHPPDREFIPRGSVVKLDESVMGRALKDQALTVRRVRKDGKYFEDDVLSRLGMKVLCVVPLVATNGPVGTLNLAAADEDCFTDARIKLLERIADSLALAVEHSRLFSRVARFAEELEETVERRTRELQAAQAKLVQAEKFAATGSIAAHIGHEVNNPLSIIKNYLRISTGRMTKIQPTQEDIEAARENLAIIEEEIDRIARIISQLRQVSRPSKGEMALMDLPAEIHKIAELFEGTMHKKNVQLKLDLDQNLVSIWACSDYIRQILINLLRNSMDAIEQKNGGTITIRTLPRKPGANSFTVEVEDTGSGIPRDTISKVFDPFFTTKGEGKGTGLGLSVSFGLAQSMGGTMEAESIVGQGTTIRLILPLRTEQVSADLVARPDEDSVIIRRQGSKIIIG